MKNVEKIFLGTVLAVSVIVGLSLRLYDSSKMLKIEKAENKTLIEEVTQQDTTITEKIKENEILRENLEILKQDEYIYLGKFVTTGYCNCEKCCGKWAGGTTYTQTTPQQGRTIAVDPNTIPLGCKVLIDGNVYIAEDTGNAIKGNRIDVFYNAHNDAQNHGKQVKDIFIKIGE